MEKYNILPTTVYAENIISMFSSEIEAMTVDHSIEKVGVNPHHFSKDKYVLNLPQFAKLKEYIEKFSTRYFREVLNIDSDAIVTQSWINASKPGEHTHYHVHPNSFGSGVLYLSVSGQNAGITFHKSPVHSGHSGYILQPKTNGAPPTSEFFWVRTGDLIIFPSYLPHSVPKNPTDQVRWSLAFNTLTKECIGAYDDLNHIKLAQ